MKTTRTNDGGFTRTLAATVTCLLVALPAGAQQIQVRPPTMVASSSLPDVVELSSITIDPALLDLVDRLTDEAYEQRESATAQILGDRFELTQVLAVLQQESLTAEQRHRLLTVVREQLIGTPRGALGISMRWRQENVLEPGEVEVIDLLPGLPAERVLRLGDRINAIDDGPLFRQEDLIRRVQTKLPGESIDLSLRRAIRDDRGKRVLDEVGQPVFEEIRLDLVLGSAELLVDPGSGRATRQSPVERERIGDANEAAQRYGHQPNTIAWRSPDRASFGSTVSELGDEIIDQDRAIQTLLRQRRLIRDGRGELNSKLRMTWMQQHQRLVSRSTEPGITDSERLYYRRVAERYAELMMP